MAPARRKWKLMSEKPRLCSFQSLGPNGFHEVAYTEWGDPQSPRLVFCVHGYTRNSRDFDVLAESLAEECHVVCMDVAGRGRSEWLAKKNDYSFSLYLTDAAALLSRVTAPPPPPTGLKRIFRRTQPKPKRHIDWIGTSMGGLIGMMLAARRNSPIRRLILNDVGPLVPWPALMRMKKAQTGLGRSFSCLEDVEFHLRETCASFGPLTETQWRKVTTNSAIEQRDGSYVLAFDPAIITHMRSGGVTGVAFGSEFLAGVDLWPTYEAIRCPTLVLRGAESDLLLGKIADDMMRRGPRAKIVEFEGIGHAPWLMAEDQIAAVRDFLFASAAKAPAAEPVRREKVALHPA